MQNEVGNLPSTRISREERAICPDAHLLYLLAVSQSRIGRPQFGRKFSDMNLQYFEL